MPLRPFNREQAWLLPPSLDELVPEAHPARFVDMLLDGLGDEEWDELGIDPGGVGVGPPAYHPRVLLGVWVYGFMDGVRTTRKLERACQDRVPYIWLSCMQRPDHNTLWRFYRAHRERMRSLLRLSVRIAVGMDLLDLAFQAVDGTKVQANASRERMLGENGLERLLERLDGAVLEMEEQNGGESEPAPAGLPATLAGRDALRRRVAEALGRVRGDDGPPEAPGPGGGQGGRPAQVSPADPDAGLLRARGGYVAGYNAQAVASPLADGGGMLVTAAEVPRDADDHAQLLPMIAQAEANAGVRAGATLADANYHSGPNLARCASLKIVALMPEASAKQQKDPYHKNNFTHRQEDDAYTCPHGQELTFRGMQRRPEKGYEARRYKATPGACRACPAFGECTTSASGRTIYVTPNEDLLQRHRQMMAGPGARELYRRRKHTIEPVFGILKEQMGSRRFLLRGLANVRAEWSLLAAAFNLRSLHRIWSRGLAPRTAPAAA